MVAWLSESGFAGFFWIIGMAGVFGRGRSVTSVCECCTRVCKSSREFACVCGLSESGFAGFFWIFRMAGVFGRGRSVTSVCECCTRVCKSSREFACVCGLSETGFARFFWIFRMAGVSGRGRSVTSVCVCCTRVYKSSREFACVCERFPFVRLKSDQVGLCRLGFPLALLQERYWRLPARIGGRLLVWASSRMSSRREDSRRLPA